MMAFINDLGIAFRSLSRTKGLAFTVILTLALGIGANAAIFTLVRGVLLKPLVNRDENRLIYIRQSAPGADQSDAAFSVPEIQDLRASVKTLSAIGDFSAVTRVIRGLSADQPVEHAATLEDVRAEVLTPDRLNSLVFGVFAAVALAIALVGVAGVLAFSVSARTREFGIRLALGSQPRNLLKGVIAEGAVMAAAGVLAGAAFGYVVARLAGSYFLDIQMPGALPVILSAFVLLAAAVVASSLPAVRAARIDVIQALRAH